MSCSPHLCSAFLSHKQAQDFDLVTVGRQPLLCWLAIIVLCQDRFIVVHTSNMTQSKYERQCYLWFHRFRMNTHSIMIKLGIALLLHSSTEIVGQYPVPFLPRIKNKSRLWLFGILSQCNAHTPLSNQWKPQMQEHSLDQTEMGGKYLHCNC